MTLDRREQLVVAAVLLTAAVLVWQRGGDDRLGERLDHRIWDLVQARVLDAPADVDDVLVVKIDDESLAALDARWPLDRTVWARFVDLVSSYGPAAIVIDVWFEVPAPLGQVELAEEAMDRVSFSGLAETPEGGQLLRWLDLVALERDADRVFAQALGASGRVVLGVACPEVAGDTLGLRRLAAPWKLELDPAAVDYACAGPIGNLAPLAMASAGESGLDVAFSPDGRIRRYPYAAKVPGSENAEPYVLPLLATSAAYLAVGADDEARSAVDERVAAWAADPPVLRYRTRDAFRDVRFSDLLLGGKGNDALKAAIEGKVVFLGVSATGTEDLRSTALEVDIPGVYVHANAYANLRDGRAFRTDAGVRRTDRLAGLAILLLLGLTALAGTKMTGRHVLGATALAAGGGLALSAWRMAGGEAAAFALVPLAATAWGGTKLWFAYLRNADAQRQAEAVREAFKFYLAPAVVEQLVDNPELLRLGGERRVITAFFSDVAGFTTISETLDPQDLSLLLNECLGAMTDVILEEGGTVDKYIGDAIVAMFGAPLDQPDHADRALAAALRCQEVLDGLRPQWRERGWPEVIVRIGVNTGVATVGNMGSSQRFDYTMLGDTVNLAARLEGANKQYGTLILAGAATAAAVRETTVREIDLVMVKGKTEGVSIFTPEADADVIAGTAEAVAAYREQRWADARAAFAGLPSGDPIAATYAARIDALEAAPPGSDWDGVYRMTTK